MKLGKWARAALKAAWHQTATVNLIVTRRCDLQCSYCQVLRKSPELTAPDWLKIAERLASRYAVFTVSGGEPLLYRPLPELINGLSRLGIAGLCTNLRQLDADMLAAMPGLDYLNFSIDQAGATADDASSRKNAFGKLELVAEHARRHAVALHGTAVITRRTLDGIVAVVETLTRHGIPLNLQLVQQAQGADAFATPQDLADLGRLSTELLALKRAGYLIDEPDAYLAGFVPYLRGEACVPCHAGRAYLAVDTDGRAMPCQACTATGPALHEVANLADLDAALHALPAAIPHGCRCWWNCYHWYGDWVRAPWRYMARQGLAMIRPPRPPRPMSAA